MADSSGRRISLDPIFEHFDLLDIEPAASPHGINGYHVASSCDEEINLFGGLGCQSIEPSAVAGSNGAKPSVEPNGTAANGTSANGAASNGSGANGSVSNGAVSNGDVFVAHSAPESTAAQPNASHAEAAETSTEPAASEADFEVVDLLHDPAVHDLPVEAELPALEEMPVSSDQSVTADDAAVADAFDAPADELVDPHAQSFEADASPSAAAAQSDRNAHPAVGSMFVPYLVTEIRELRNRTSRRRSWWRRLFGR